MLIFKHPVKEHKKNFSYTFYTHNFNFHTSASTWMYVSAAILVLEG